MKKFIAVSLACIFGAVACASTAQFEANTITVEQLACVAAEAAASLIPPGGVEVAAADIALVCPQVPFAAIVQFLVNEFAKQPASTASSYVPSPHVAAAKAAKASHK